MEANLDADPGGDGLSIFSGGCELPFQHSLNCALVNIFFQRLENFRLFRLSLCIHNHGNKHRPRDPEALRRVIRLDLARYPRRSDARSQGDDFVRFRYLLAKKRSPRSEPKGSKADNEKGNDQPEATHYSYSLQYRVDTQGGKVRDNGWTVLRVRLFRQILPVLAAFLAPGLLPAESQWVRARMGSFETISDSGRKAAVQGLSQFEQFRFVLGKAMGQSELRLDPPVRILVFKDAKELASLGCSGWQEGRDRVMACTTAEGQLPTDLIRELTRRLLEANFSALPPQVERAVEAFFSTVKSNALHVMWGEPPPPAERTRDWAQLHYLITQPAWAGRAHIYLHNLATGMNAATAVRSLGEDPAVFSAEIDRYLAAGVFTAVQAPNRPLNPDRDFNTNMLTSDEGQLARADLLNNNSTDAYKAILKAGKQLAEANEGLATLALRGDDKALARRYFQAARQAGSRNPVALTKYAALEQDDQLAIEILQEALTSDDKYAPAHWTLGERVGPGGRRLAEWKQAVAMAPRNTDWLTRYAKHCVENKMFAEAGRAWLAAAQSAPDDSSRDLYLAERGKIEQLRLDDEAAEKRKEAGAKAAELERLKSQARRELADLEARSSRKPLSKEEATKVVDWDDVHATATVDGTILKADCVGKELRVDIRNAAGKILRFRAVTTEQMEIRGGDGHLNCGAQKPRPVTIGYRPLRSDKVWTGDLFTIDVR